MVVALIGLMLTVGLAAGLRSTLAPYIRDFLAHNAVLPALSVNSTAQAMAVAVVSVYSFLGHKWLSFGRGLRFQLSRLGRLTGRKINQASRQLKIAIPSPNRPTSDHCWERPEFPKAS